MKKLGQAALLAAALMMPSVKAVIAEEFYEMRLRIGEAAYVEKRLPDAVDNLRIAAFGLLEKPALESEALVYLALAQTAVGRAADADATLTRFLEVERLFAPYARLQLDANVQAEFRALLHRRVAEATLIAYPGLAALVETEEQKIAKLPPKDRSKAYEAAARSEPKNPRWPVALARDAAAADDQRAVILWAGKALEIDPTLAEARALRAHALTTQGQWASARSDLDALAADELAGRPVLVADRFVCLVELKDWNPARELAPAVPASQNGRSDVVLAKQRLANQTSQK